MLGYVHSLGLYGQLADGGVRFPRSSKVDKDNRLQVVPIGLHVTCKGQEGIR